MTFIAAPPHPVLYTVVKLQNNLPDLLYASISEKVSFCNSHIIIIISRQAENQECCLTGTCISENYHSQQVGVISQKQSFHQKKRACYQKEKQALADK